ncbi:hypothetical protein bcgnr5414_65310 [Bacillus cereus]
MHELFTRKLKEGKRSIDTDASSIVSPVDGVFADYGPIEDAKTAITSTVGKCSLINSSNPAAIA